MILSRKVPLFSPAVYTNSHPGKFYCVPFGRKFRLDPVFSRARSGLVEKLPVMFYCHVIRCVRFVRQARWRFEMPELFGIWLFIFTHAKPFLRLRRSDFDSSIDLKLIFQEMSAGKGETKKKKGLTWAEAAKQVLKLYMAAQRSLCQQSARSCVVSLMLFYPNWAIFSLPLGIGEVGWSSHTQRYP